MTQASDKLRQLLNPKQDVWVGFLGDENDNVDGDRPGERLVRVRQAGSDSYVVGSFPSRIALNNWPGLPVWISHDPLTGEQYISGIDEATLQYGDSGITPSEAQMSPHAARHEWRTNANDQLKWLNSQQIFPLRVQPSSESQHVLIQSGVFFAGGQIAWSRDIIDLDLSSYYPASGGAWVMVTIDNTLSVTIVQKNGGGDALTLESLGPIPLGNIALAAVKLTVGSEIDWINDESGDVRDLRFIPQFDSSILGGGSVIVGPTALVLDINDYDQHSGKWAALIALQIATKDFIGTEIVNDTDNAAFGLLKEGSDRYDTVILFGDNDDDHFKIYRWNYGADTLELVFDIDTDGNITTVTGATIGQVGAIQFDVTYTNGSGEGLVSWNSDDGTLQVGMPGGNVIGQLLQEMMFRVSNDDGAALDNGTAVLVNGATGNRLTVRIPDLTVDTDTFATIALVTEDIADPGIGYVTTEGYVRGFDTSAISDGGQAFLGANGTLSATPATKPDRTVFLGIVKKSHATEGEIWVKIIHLPMVYELSDVEIADDAGEDILMWDSDVGVWRNRPLFPTAKRAPTGFEKAADGEPPTDSTVSYDQGTRTISIAPTGTEFYYWLRGKRITINSTLSENHPATTGLYFFYWDDTETLQFSTTPWSILEDVPIAYIYWDGLNSYGILFEERHGATRNPSWHYSDHYNRGMYWHTGEGLAIGGYTLQPASPADINNQWTISAGEIHDEDIAFQSTGKTSAVGGYNVFYRTGATGAITWDNDTLPLLSGTYIQYNEWTGATWQKTDAANNNYVNYYIMATSSIDADFDIFTFMGQAVHTNLADAQAENIADLDLSGLPFQEILSIYKVTFRTGAAYSSTGKCRIEAVEDTRLTTGRQVIAAAPATNHNGLDGLQGGTSGEYYHLTSAEYTEATRYANTTQGGLLFELATNAETQAGSDTSRAVTPTGLHADIPAVPAASRGVRLDASGDALLPGKVIADDNIATGVSSTLGSFHAERETTNASMLIRTYNNTVGVFSIFQGGKSRGTQSSPSATNSNDLLMRFSAIGYKTTGWSGSRCNIDMYANENFTDTANGTRMLFLVTENGTTSALEAMRITHDRNVVIGSSSHTNGLLDVNGDINTREQYLVDGTQVVTNRQSVGAALGASTAGATYGTTEQTMLQNAYDRIRTLETALRTHGLIED